MNQNASFTGIKQLNNQKGFIECSNNMNDAYEHIDEYNATGKRKILIVFDDMIPGIVCDKKSHAFV